MAKTYIVIPTYNEKDNVVLLLERIFSLAINDLYVLVVDDNSPDGTGAMVEKVKRQYPNLKILHRPAKAGLGSPSISLVSYLDQRRHGSLRKSLITPALSSMG